MKNRKNKIKVKTKTKISSKKYIVVTNKNYGSELKGTKIYFEGKKPKGLNEDGSIKFGKNILELFRRNFDKFHLIITQKTDSINKAYGIYKIKISVRSLSKLNSLLIDRTRDIKNDILKSFFSSNYPEQFKTDHVTVYVPGTLAKILYPDISKKLSSEDRNALSTFLPDFIASESVSSVNILKAAAQIKTLKEFVIDMRQAIADERSESWWQNYIHSNLLIIQQGYINAIEKMNTAIGTTKYPDFCLVTHDGYLDILEIKKPTTLLLKLDSSRGNYYWDTEISKAMIQVENYIENISKHADKFRNYIFDTYNIILKLIRPR